MNQSQFSVGGRYLNTSTDQHYDQYEFTLAKRTPQPISRKKKTISIDMNTPYYQKNKIRIKKPEEQLKEDLNGSMIKKARPSSVSSTPMRPSKKKTTEEVKQTIDSMLERFKEKEEKKQRNLELMKLMKEEEEAANLMYRPKVLNKNIKVPDDDFLKRQEIYKEQLDKKIQELQALQQEKKLEMEKANPAYGLHLEEQEIQEKIEWMRKWKEQVTQRNLERKKELAKKLMEECTFQPNISNYSRLLAENNPKRMKIDRFQGGDDRGKSAPKKRNNSAKVESRPKNMKTSPNNEDIKILQKNLKKMNTKTVIKTTKPSIPMQKSKVLAPTIPSNTSSKRSLVSQQDKKGSDKNVLIKNGIFDEKGLDNFTLMKMIQNKPQGGSDTPAGEFSMKNKKVLPKLSDRDYEIMQELFMKKMNGGDDK
jgi:hypothetical protein